MEERVVGGIGVHQYVVFTVGSKRLAHIFIGSHSHALTFQIALHLVGQFSRVNEQCGLFLTDEQIRHKHRVAMHIRPTQVERPCNVVEGSHQHATSMYSGEALSDAGQF